MTAVRRHSMEPSDTILDAALHVFASHGFAAATLEEIARRAGFSHQTVRDRFVDKARLWRAVQQAGWEQLMAAVARRVAIGVDPDARLRGALEALVHVGEASPARLQVLLRCDPAAPPADGVHDLRQWLATMLADAGCTASAVYAAMIIGVACGLCGHGDAPGPTAALVLDEIVRHAIRS
jgi:AcrR family transcriptional regulator